MSPTGAREAATHVDFWFDPICPFCWVTSRWLNRVQTERDLDITWNPISLFFKNEPDQDSGFYEPTVKTRNLLRVVESVRAVDGKAGRVGLFGPVITELPDLDDSLDL